MRLSGYGVELAIKSTEYKAQDDTKVKGGFGAMAHIHHLRCDYAGGFNENSLANEMILSSRGKECGGL